MDDNTRRTVLTRIDVTVLPLPELNKLLHADNCEPSAMILNARNDERFRSDSSKERGAEELALTRFYRKPSLLQSSSCKHGRLGRNLMLNFCAVDGEIGCSE